MKRAIAYRPMLALAIGLAAALAWHVSPLTLLFATPFFAFRRTWPFALVGIFLGLCLAPLPVTPIQDRQLVEGELDVASVPRMRPGRIEFDGLAAQRRWSVTVKGKPDIALGDRLVITGVGSPLSVGSDQYARLQGIEGRLKVVKWSTKERGSWIAQSADRWRRSFSAFCERYMRPDVAALTEALGMNLDGTLDEVTRNRLRATGTVHIVSASGLHVFVIAGFLTWVLSLLPLPRLAQLFILTALLAIYALATGLNAPVIRSIFMAIVGLSAYAFRRDRDGLSSLALAAFLYLLWRPRGIFDIGFQLSFLTVAGLIAFGPTAEDYPRTMPDYLYRLAKDGLRLSWVAFAVSAPLVAYYFGTVSVVALPANLLIAMAVPIVVVGGLLAHAISGVSLALGVGMIKLMEVIGAYVLAVLEGLGNLAWAQFSVPAFPLELLIVIYVVMALSWRERYVRP